MNLHDFNNKKALNSAEFIIFTNVISLLVILAGFFIYNQVSNNKIGIHSLNKLTPKHWGYFVLHSLVTLGATFILVFVLGKSKVSHIMSFIQAGVIVLTYLISTILLKESITWLQGIAAVLICGGIILLGLNKN